MSGSLRTKSSVSAPVRGSSGTLFQTPFLPQELKAIHELEAKIEQSAVTNASLADLQKELALISSIAHSRIQMLKYCHIPVLGKSLMEDIKIAVLEQDLDIDDLDIDDTDNEEIRKSYSNWRQGGAIGTAIVQPPKTTSQVMMPSTAIYLRAPRKPAGKGKMSFFGVDSAVYGSPKNTEPMFPTYNAVISHIASMH